MDGMLHYLIRCWGRNGDVTTAARSAYNAIKHAQVVAVALLLLK